MRKLPATGRYYRAAGSLFVFSTAFMLSSIRAELSVTWIPDPDSGDKAVEGRLRFLPNVFRHLIKKGDRFVPDSRKSTCFLHL